MYGLIEGFPNYVIRSDGVVINIKFKREMKNALWTNPKSGYQKYRCCLSHAGKQKNFTISILLAKAFISGQSDDRNSVDHIDQNSLNNNLSNLRWANMSEQIINQSHPPNILNEKNIYKNRNRYQFQIIRKGVTHSKTFKTLEEAIKYREEYFTQLGERLNRSPAY
tara:strand:+ start:631 stop:1128 length:498 start_codon:yes stop_codon:yes gene_type:complete